MRRTIAAALALAVVMPAIFVRPALAGPARLTLTVDDRRAGVMVVERERDRLDVPLGAVAAALGWRLTHAASVWQLRGEGHAFVLHAGSRNVTDDGAVAVVLHHEPVERERALFIASDDVAPLFGVRATIANGGLVVSTTVLDAGVAVAERRKPLVRVAVPQPTPSPTAAPFGSYGTDRVALTIVRRGRQQTYGAAITTTGTIRTGFAVSDDGLPPTGSTTLGTKDRNVTLGGTSDPLTGAVFHDAGLVGTDVHAGAYDTFGGRRMRDGRTVAGFARRHGAQTDFVELLRAPGGAFDQVIAGHRVDQTTSWGALREEVFASAKGLAAGAYARTRGRFYGELTATAAGGGLPLDAGDAPLVGDGAYDLSRATTARAGIAAGRGQRASPFVGLLERGAHLGGSVTFASRFTGLSASYANSGANAQLAMSRAAGATSYAFRSSALLRGSSLDLSVNADELGDRDLTFEVRLPRHGYDLFAGFETARLNGESWSSPIAGLALPLFRGLDLEASILPIGSKPALRVSLVAGFTPPHRAARAVTVPFALRVASAQPESIAVYVDGFKVKQLPAGDGRIDISPGRHTIRIESADGLRGSPEREIDTAGVREAVLELWPFRTISGRVAIDAPASLIPRDIGLGGIGVVLEPGGIPATVDDSGRFTFPSAPVAPGAVVRIDESSVPAGLAALGPVVVEAGGDVVVRLGSGRRVETTIFPKS